MEHILAVKYDMGYEKKMSFLVIPKSPKVFKKRWKIKLGCFKMKLIFNMLLLSEWVPAIWC